MAALASEPEILRALYWLYNLVMLTIAMTFFVCELIAFRRAFGDLTALLSEIGMLFTHAVGMGKLWILMYKKDDIDRTKKKLGDVRFQYEPIDDFQPGLQMKKAKRLLVYISSFIFCLYSFVGVSAHISAILVIRKNTIDNIFIGNISCESLLPYYYYYPFDVDTAIGCHYSLFYMDISFDIFAFYIATLDALFVSLLHYLATQLNILAGALTTIRKRCLKKLKIDPKFAPFNDSDCAQLENEMYDELVHCTEHLYILLDARNDIERIFNFIMLVQTLASLLIFASCLFVAGRVPVTSPNFFSQMEYFSAVLAQFAVYCFFGNQMTFAGASLPMAIYNSDWYSASRRFKGSMVLTMARMQRDLYVSIGKFAPLALGTFLGVVKGSFSYFTLFQRAGQ